MPTTKPKREKRIYLKKRLLSQDEFILSKPLSFVIEVLEKRLDIK